MTQPTKSNVSNATKALIIKTGYQLQVEKNIKLKKPIDAPTKIMPTQIRRRIGGNHYEPHNKPLNIKTVTHWWRNGREKFEKGESLEAQPRSGRPPHKAFATEEKVQEVVDYALNMPMGYHKSDVMEKFDIRSKNTLDKYTREFIVWVYSPWQHSRDNEEV